MIITIPGTPIPKERHRCACKKFGAIPYSYDPQLKSVVPAVKSIITRAMRDAQTSKNEETRVEAISLTNAPLYELSCVFVFPVQNSIHWKERNWRLWGLAPYDHKPDLDNLEKFYADCGTGIIWGDDSKIVKNSSIKIYGNNPRTEMHIKAIGEEKMKESTKIVVSNMGPDQVNDMLNDMKEFPKSWETDTTYSVKFLEELSQKIADFALKYADELKLIKKGISKNA